MIDIKRIRKEAEVVEELLKRRKPDLSLGEVLKYDEERRSLLNQVEQMKAEQNKVSKQIPMLKKEGKDVFITFKTSTKDAVRLYMRELLIGNKTVH